MTKSISSKSYRLFLHITLPMLFAFSILVAVFGAWSCTIYAEPSPYKEDMEYPWLATSGLNTFTAIFTCLDSIFLFTLTFLRNTNPNKGHFSLAKEDVFGKMISPSFVTGHFVFLWCLWVASVVLSLLGLTHQCVYDGNDLTCFYNIFVIAFGIVCTGFIVIQLGFFIAYSVAVKGEQRTEVEFLRIEEVGKGAGSDKEQ